VNRAEPFQPQNRLIVVITLYAASVTTEPTEAASARSSPTGAY
jgi:hypothetical protein